MNAEEKNDKKKFLNSKHARTDEQFALMKKIERDGVCPFCKEHFLTYHPKPIIKETDWWFVTENINPYKNTKLHYIFVYKREHITLPTEMSGEAAQDLFSSINWVIEKNKLIGGSVFMRFGDTDYTGSSVNHLHAHLIVGDIENPNYERIRVKLG